MKCFTETSEVNVLKHFFVQQPGQIFTVYTFNLKSVFRVIVFLLCSTPLWNSSVCRKKKIIILYVHKQKSNISTATAIYINIYKVYIYILYDINMSCGRWQVSEVDGK